MPEEITRKLPRSLITTVWSESVRDWDSDEQLCDSPKHGARYPVLCCPRSTVRGWTLKKATELGVHM